MKKILPLILTITILLIVVNCDKPQVYSPIDDITVTPQSVFIPEVGGEQTLTISITKAKNWTVSPDDTWLTATPLNATSVKIEAGANANSGRSTVLRFTAGTATATVNVSQGQTTAMQNDSLALVDLYNATAGGAWTIKWTLTMPLRQWQGVTVANNRVTELNLSANNLTGALTESFGNLTALQHCDLSKNSLSGAVPAKFNQLTELKFLDLSENTLSGNFPAINALTKLFVLDISFNNFTALPALNSFTNLEYLAFSKNNLSGTLPDNISALTKLIYLDASFNNFSGNIPAAWLSLTKMKALYLYKNSLGGSIPAYIATSFTVLETLALDGNNLTGDIPSDLGNLPKLAELWLAQNRLAGEIPYSLLINSHWNDWEINVCPQQSGSGFSNCSAGTTSLILQSAKISSRASEFKEMIIKNLEIRIKN